MEKLLAKCSSKCSDKRLGIELGMLESYKNIEKISSNNLILKIVEVDDAEFILNLRLDPIKGKYLSPTSNSLEIQKKWIEDIKRKSDERYFVVYDVNEKKVGTIRIYNVVKDFFTWGTWLFIKEVPFNYPIESALIIYEFSLKFRLGSAKFDVRKNNIKVWKFHENFGATRIKEDNSNYYYELNKEGIIKGLEKYSRFRPQNLKFISKLNE